MVLKHVNKHNKFSNHTKERLEYNMQSNIDSNSSIAFLIEVSYLTTRHFTRKRYKGNNRYRKSVKHTLFQTESLDGTLARSHLLDCSKNCSNISHDIT